MVHVGRFGRLPGWACRVPLLSVPLFGAFAACAGEPASEPAVLRQDAEDASALASGASEDDDPVAPAESEVATNDDGECPASYELCDDRCVDLGTHPEHCGACGDFCGRRETCVGGSCVDCEADPELCEAQGPVPAGSTSEPDGATTEPAASGQPEPVSMAEPESGVPPEPSGEPGVTPQADPEPSPPPSPGPVGEPDATPEPVPEPEPLAEPSAEPEPLAEPSAEPEPLAVPEPEPAITPEPAMTVEPEMVEPEPSPEPEPVPSPVPEPSVVPDPAECIDLPPNMTAADLGSGEVCLLFHAPVAGWQGSNFLGSSRTITVNGVLMDVVGQMPLPPAVDGLYVVVVSAGEPSYASLSYW